MDLTTGKLTMPPLQGVPVDVSRPVAIAPRSYGFITIDMAVSACAFGADHVYVL